MALADRIADYHRFEAVRLRAYWDPTGQCWTCGCGHTGAGVGQNTVCTPELADRWLSDDDAAAQAGLDADPAWSGPRWTWRAKLDDARQDAVIELAFNMGERTLDEFKVMRGCLEAGDFAGAAGAARDSAWYGEVNGDGRGDFICNLIATGARAA